MGVIWFLLVIVAVGVVLIVRRGLAFKALAERGVPVRGTIVSRFRTHASGPGSRGRRVAFTYTGPDGQSYRRAATVSIGHFAELAEGCPIDLYCLPDRPGTSAPAWLVEDARKALRK